MFSDGIWSDWSQWSSCSLSCGGGNQTQIRTCTKPEPANGGQNCSLTNIDTAVQTCNNQPCPIGEIFLTDFHCIKRQCTQMDTHTHTHTHKEEGNRLLASDLKLFKCEDKHRVIEN